MQAIIVFESYEKYFVFARVCASQVLGKKVISNRKEKQYNKSIYLSICECARNRIRKIAAAAAKKRSCVCVCSCELPYVADDHDMFVRLTACHCLQIQTDGSSFMPANVVIPWINWLICEALNLQCCAKRCRISLLNFVARLYHPLHTHSHSSWWWWIMKETRPKLIILPIANRGDRTDIIRISYERWTCWLESK